MENRVEDKSRMREKVRKDTEKYLKGGGEIEDLGYRPYTVADIKEQRKRNKKNKAKVYYLEMHKRG